MERIFTPDELGQGFRKNAEAIEAIQETINALEVSVNPDNAHLTTRVEELEAQVADLVSAVELLLKRL